VGIGMEKDSFNYCLSVRRQVIERAFGILVRRWGIFWRPITASMTKWSLIATVAAKLHNICIDANDAPVNRYQDDIHRHDHEDVYLNPAHTEDPNTPVQATAITGSTRARLTSLIYEKGVRRPAYAGRNSRAYLLIYVVTIVNYTLTLANA